MLANYRAEIVVARNAGGDSASAKIEAARDLALPVVMVRRPFIPARERTRDGWVSDPSVVHAFRAVDGQERSHK